MEPLVARATARSVWTFKSSTGLLDLAGEIAMAKGRLPRPWVAAKKPEKTPLKPASNWNAFLGFTEKRSCWKSPHGARGPGFSPVCSGRTRCRAGGGSGGAPRLGRRRGEIDVQTWSNISKIRSRTVRNAIDHGIESPETRRARGKDPCGLLTLKAFHEGGNIVVQLIDDSTGLNCERIITRAKERGWVTNSDKLSEQGYFPVHFRTRGFRQRATITERSCRDGGVGMEVLGATRSRRGSVGLQSEAGRGAALCSICRWRWRSSSRRFRFSASATILIFCVTCSGECSGHSSSQDSLAPTAEEIINLRGEPQAFLLVRPSRRFGIEASRPGRRLPLPSSWHPRVSRPGSS